MNATAICYVICWRYSDNSGHGLVGYSFDKAQAEAILGLLRKHAETRAFDLVETGALPAYP